MGLTQYEAKAYIALVSLSSASAPEISRQSKVPKAKIYDVLNSLTEKGLVNFGPGSPMLFKARDPQTMINHLKEKYNKLAGEVSDELSNLKPITKVVPFATAWSLPSEKVIIEKIKDLINESQPLKIMASLDLLEIILSPYKDNELMIISPSLWKKIPSAKNRLYSSHMKKMMKDIVCTPHFTLIADQKGVLICGYGSDSKVSGSYLEIPLFTYFTSNHFNQLWKTLA